MADTKPLSDDDRAELVAYLDGELDTAGAARIETRMRTDPRLRAEADAYRQTWELLDHLPQPEPSPTLATRTLQEISAVGGAGETTSPRWPGARSLAWAAGLLVAAGLGYALTPASRVDVDLESDPLFKSESRMIKDLPLYLAVENIDFLQSLDTSELFGEDAVGR